MLILKCCVVIHRSDVDELNVVDRKRYELFNEIFADVDGANVSQLDR